MMRFILNSSAFVILFASTLCHFALAQTEVSKKIIPVVMLLLEEEAAPLVPDISEWQGVETVSIADLANQNQSEYKVVLDETGNGWVAWRQGDGTNPNKDSIWVNYYDSESGWGAAENIETLDWDAQTLTIAMNSSGDVVVVWGYEVPSNVELWESHLTAGNSTWSAPVFITSGMDNLTTTWPTEPQVAIDDNSKVLLVWRESINLKSVNYTLGNNTAGTVAELTDSALTLRPLQLDMNANGQAIAIWGARKTFLGSAGFGVTRPIVKARMFEPINGWGIEQEISFANDSTAIDGSTGSKVKINALGDAIVVWSHHKNLPNFNSETNIWARNYSVTNGWQASVLLETNDFKFAISPEIAINNSGNAVVVWVHKPEDLASGLKSIWSNQYNPNSGWAGEQEINPFGIWQNVFPVPQIGLDASGNAMVVWMRKLNNEFNIEAIRFDKPTNNWEEIETLSLEREMAEDPVLATNNAGRALAVWKTGSFFGPHELKSNYFR